MAIIENDINKIKQTIIGKTIKDVTSTGTDITVTFTDGSKFVIRSFQYQLFVD